MSKLLIGIDFGTWNLKVSKWNKKRSEPEIVKIDMNQNNSDCAIKNAIKYPEKMIGDRAYERVEEKSVVAQVKRKLEKKSWERYIEEIDRRVNSVEVATDIFRSIKETIEAKNSEIDKVVITVPVIFSEVQKNRVLRAAQNAELNVVDVITEPLAGLFYYEEYFEEEELEENILVFDFGGGTLDISIFNIQNSGEGDIRVDIKAANGMRFGGVDIDELLYNELVIKQIPKDFNLGETQKDIESNIKKIKSLVEKLKKELFIEEDEEEVEDVVLLNHGDTLNVILNRGEVKRIFEAEQLKHRIEELLDNLLVDSKLEKNEITKVKVVGGTSRISYFKEILSEYFNDSEVFDSSDIDSDEIYRAVSDGAVRYLKMKLESDDISLKIKNRIGYSIGVSDNNIFKPLIERNRLYGFTSKLMRVKDYVEEDKVNIYQLFKRKSNATIKDDGIYMGYFKIDSSKDLDELFFEITIGNKGELVADLKLEEDLDNPIESLKLTVGD